jgi:hypothetical protein
MKSKQLKSSGLAAERTQSRKPSILEGPDQAYRTQLHWCMQFGVYSPNMNFGSFLKAPWLIGLGLAVIAAIIVRGFWLYWASLTWPTADGVIIRIDIERKYSGGSARGHYFSATFTYDFRDARGNRVSGSWYKNFSSESEAREFAERELPVDKKVVVRFNPKSPIQNNLELDSWTYTGDRPTSLNI